jgi:hypothetical protein
MKQRVAFIHANVIHIVTIIIILSVVVINDESELSLALSPVSTPPVKSQPIYFLHNITGRGVVETAADCIINRDVEIENQPVESDRK